MKKSRKAVSLLLALIMAIGLTFTTGCSKKADPAKTIILTVGDHDIYLNEAMFYIYNVEAAGAYYDQSYRQYYGTSYWDIEQDGITMREKTKQYVIDTLVMYEILYEKALADGLKLTDEEQTANQTKVDQMLAALTDEQLKTTGFTKESLLKVNEKVVVGEKYYNKLVDTFDIDDQAIKDTVNKDDYKEYKTEYLFVPTAKYDESYNVVQLSDEEKTTAKNSINAALKEVKAGKEFSEIIKNDETLTTNTRDFVSGDSTTEKPYQDAAAALGKGEFTSSPVQTDYGYYIIKMVDNEATDRYDSAVTDAITKAETDKFTTEFEKIKKDYNITVNDKVWDTIVMGETTIAKTSDSSNTGSSGTTDTNTKDSGNTGSDTSDSNTTESK